MMLKKFFQSTPRPTSPTLESEIRFVALQFSKQLKDQGIDPRDPPAAADAFIQSHRGAGTSPPAADVTSDLAAFLGDHALRQFSGAWGDDPLFGISILGPGRVAHAVLGPYQIVRKKWQLGEALSLPSFFGNLGAHLEKEARRLQLPAPLPNPGQILADKEEEFAKTAASHSRAFLSDELGTDVPATLVGLRSAERWLRGQFLIRTAQPDDFERLGLLLGEIMRGLYAGRWSFEKARTTGQWSDVALTFPELPFYPIGRVFKLLVEQPEGNGLDDYVRLVPAARKDSKQG